MIPAPFNESPSAVPYLTITIILHGIYPPYAVNAAQTGILQNAGAPGYCRYDLGMSAKATVSKISREIHEAENNQA